MPKPTKTMRTIMGRYADLQLDMPLCLKHTKMFLEQYRSLSWLLRCDIEDILARGTAFSGDAIHPGLFYLADFAPEPTRQEFSDTVAHIHRGRASLQILEHGVQQLQSYSPYGSAYYDILFHQYLAPHALNEHALCASLSIERSTFYVRKREAIALLGLSLFTVLSPPAGEHPLH